ncbi:carboxylesterase/lipase family protein [Qaidamihabitans albus]|uniref:carboxylesterase/lipase family protein n=1 Tax=Qaidamihabitans albus TaxID=2795733 RepID=UPI0018F18FB6|nr:carboxylesterase family protein [Qaidamihabitans albus]
MNTMLSTFRHRLLVVGAAALFVVAGITTVPAPAAASVGSGPALVRTTDGWVRGRVTADHRIFQGIPYAAPPVGRLRFRASRPVTPWTGILAATRPASGCAQTYLSDSGPTFYGSEDCLYLNVHIPRDAEAPMPVMVFIHGGGLGNGDGGAYDPRRVTRQGGVIVVTLNYRLGALGFLHHPTLGDRWAGNVGIADQQAALRWVRRDIAAFGGDPGNITLWGESAGAYSVCAQIASPAARGLFDKAITQSGPCGNDFVTSWEARRRAQVAVEELGCANTHPVVACLRRIPAREIASVKFQEVRLTRRITNLPWMPVAGTAPIPLQPMTAVRTGIGNIVPMIAGGTRDEMRTFIVDRYNLGLGLITATEYLRLIRELYGEHADEVLAEYPHTRYNSPSIALATVLTDEGQAAGACRQLIFDNLLARRAPLFAYEFTEPSIETTGGFPHGAEHGVDVPYFFDSYWTNPEPMPEPKARLAETLIEHWTTFTRTGEPGRAWTSYRPGIGRSFSTTYIGDTDLAANHRCAFWDTLDDQWPARGISRRPPDATGTPSDCGANS